MLFSGRCSLALSIRCTAFMLGLVTDYCHRFASCWLLLSGRFSGICVDDCGVLVLAFLVDTLMACMMWLVSGRELTQPRRSQIRLCDGV